MNPMEFTLEKAFKVWWGFMWRIWVLAMPLSFVLMGVMVYFVPFPKEGEMPQPENFPFWLPIFLWLVMMPTMVFLQVKALQWAFKAKWSDFRIVIVRAGETKEPEDHAPSTGPK